MIDLPTDAERRKEARRLLRGYIASWVAAEMGRDRDTVARWKRGARTPELDDLLRIAHAIKKPLNASLHRRLLGALGLIELGEPDAKERGRRASG